MVEPLMSLVLSTPLEVLELPKKLRTAAAICPEGAHVSVKLAPNSARALARWIEAHEKLSLIEDEPAPASEIGSWSEMPVPFGVFHAPSLMVSIAAILAVIAFAYVVS